MKKRIKKKKFKQYHKRFCHVDIGYEQGWSKIKYESHQCQKCGWDSLEADAEMELGKILWRTGSFYDYSFEVEYKCPFCGTLFSYVDGN